MKDNARCAWPIRRVVLSPAKCACKRRQVNPRLPDETCMPNTTGIVPGRLWPCYAPCWNLESFWDAMWGFWDALWVELWLMIVFWVCFLHFICDGLRSLRRRAHFAQSIHATIEEANADPIRRSKPGRRRIRVTGIRIKADRAEDGRCAIPLRRC